MKFKRFNSNCEKEQVLKYRSTEKLKIYITHEIPISQQSLLPHMYEKIINHRYVVSEIGIDPYMIRNDQLPRLDLNSRHSGVILP